MGAAMGIIGGAFSIASGIEKAKGLKRQGYQLEYQAKIENLRGKQVSVQHREQLNEALGTIDVISASRGLSGASVGQSARRRANQKAADRNELTDVLSSNLRREELKSSAASKRRASPFAAIGGTIRGLGQITTAIDDSAKKVAGG